MGIVIPKIAWIFLDISKLITWLFFSFFLAPEWRGYRHVLKGRQLRPKLCLCFGHTNISSCRCFGTSNSPALTSISSYSIIPDSFERWHVFKWIVISSWHSRNLQTVSELRKNPQLDFPKPEKEHFTVSVAMLPLVCFVSSPGGLGMKYKVTHISTLIWTGLNRFVSDSSRFICKEKCFICPRNFTAMSWRVISMNKIASN